MKLCYNENIMSRNYNIGNKVEIYADTQALNPYGQATGHTINKYSLGIVTGYNDKYTSETDDDFAKIKITSGDKELEGKEVWVKSTDFSHITKKY
jgi:hypothetical protein